MIKTNYGLVAYAKAQLGLPYWYGTFGQIGTEALYTSKKKQWPKFYKWEGTAYNNFPSQYGKRVHDCVGLIKGYLWSDTPTSTPEYDISQDVSANMMRANCSERGGISTMPDIPGVLVFMSGHVGVYIGGGEVIEARGHEYGVVKTKLALRPWKWWGKCPYLIYLDKDPGITIDGITTDKPGTPSAIGISSKTIKMNCKKVTVKKGNWNIRKLPSADSTAITQVKGGQELNVATGWVYVPSLGGWISNKAIDQQ